MELRFYLVQLDGKKVTDLAEHEDAIFGMLNRITTEKDEIILGDNWFSLSKLPTLDEMLMINRGLAELGLVIDA